MLQGAQAIADIIFGIASPSGRLPTTFYYENYTAQVIPENYCLTRDFDWHQQQIVKLFFKPLLLHSLQQWGALYFISFCCELQLCYTQKCSKMIFSSFFSQCLWEEAPIEQEEVCENPLKQTCCKKNHGTQDESSTALRDIEPLIAQLFSYRQKY